MTGFSAAWLALREPADRAARNADVAAAAAAHLDALPLARIVDLGSGAGSNFRAFAASIATRQAWTLVDHDAALIEAARAAMGTAGGTSGRAVATFRQADLARDIDGVLAAPADLVTAAAFFDLVSADWIEGFCAALARRRLPLYAVLTYDGEEEWRPVHARDAEMLAAFHAHQASDKGFGPAAGPAAHRHLCEQLGRHGYRLRGGPSPWRLDATQRALMAELAAGIARAAVATGTVDAMEAEAWRQARAAATSALIGHRDVFAWL